MSTIADEQSSQIINDFDLPEGWAAVKLPDICELNPPKPKADTLPADAPITFVPMPAVDAELGAITSPNIRPFAEVRKGFTAFRDGDVIFAKITPCMENGKSAIAKNLKNGLGFGSTEFHVLRPSEALTPEFIYYFVRQESYRKAAEAEMTGSVGQKRVPIDFLETTQLQLPPMAEQKRIIAKVEALVARVNSSRDHLSEAALILKHFRQAVLAAACSGNLTEDWRVKHPDVEPASELLKQERRVKPIALERNGSRVKIDDVDLPELPASWCWTTIDEVADVHGGLQKQPKRAPKQNAFPYLRVANVLRGKLDLTEVHQMELFSGELETYKLEPGDLLIVEGNGSLSEIGRSAIWTGEIKDCVHQNHIIRVRALTCPGEYLNAYWNSPLGSARIADVAVTTAGLYNLSTHKVGMMPIPMPPLREQNEIIRRIDELFKLADTIEMRTENATKRANKMNDAILSKAFRGELVPTEAELARREGREYEPASVLLERIRAEQERKNTSTGIDENTPKRSAQRSKRKSTVSRPHA